MGEEKRIDRKSRKRERERERIKREGVHGGGVARDRGNKNNNAAETSLHCRSPEEGPAGRSGGEEEEEGGGGGRNGERSGKKAAPANRGAR